MSVRIFAYGSNMCRARLLARAPSAQFLGRGYLEGYRLRFHKRSNDGSAKADAFFTGRPGHRVWGAVFEVSAADKRVIDRCEFLGIGYDERLVDVAGGPGGEGAWVYVARPEAIDARLLPYCWYRDFVIAGAEELALPEAYVERLKRVPARRDRDPRRRRRNRQLLPL